jgi:hypothetical protein
MDTSGPHLRERGAAPSASPVEHRCRYEVSLVSYFDILGMRSLLKRAGDDAEGVATVLRAARHFSQPDQGAAENWGWKFVNFSDLILRSVPVASEANRRSQLGLVFHELSDLANIQGNLLAKNVLIRGAITLGEIAVDVGLTFGPALVRAYELEAKRVVFPRIMVDPLVLAGLKEIDLLRHHDYKQEMEYIKGLIKRDTDGVWFVDYLHYMLDNVEGYEYVEFLLHHRSVVAAQLRETELLDGRTREGVRRRQKAAWLRAYHNRHLSVLSGKRVKQSTGISKAQLFI